MQRSSCSRAPPEFSQACAQAYRVTEMRHYWILSGHYFIVLVLDRYHVSKMEEPRKPWDGDIVALKGAQVPIFAKGRGRRGQQRYKQRKEQRCEQVMSTVTYLC